MSVTHAVTDHKTPNSKRFRDADPTDPHAWWSRIRRPGIYATPHAGRVRVEDVRACREYETLVAVPEHAMPAWFPRKSIRKVSLKR